MVSVISKKLAVELGSALNSDQSQMEVYAYGLEIILGALIKLLLILLLAFIVGTINTTIVFFISFALFRCFGGGAHLNTYLKCLCFGVCLIVGLGSLAQLAVSSNILLSLFVIALLVNIYMCIKWVPAGTEKKEINDPNIRLMQKIKYSIVTSAWCFAIIILIRYFYYSYAFATILASLFSSFLISPAGYRLLNAIDNNFNIRKEGENYV